MEEKLSLQKLQGSYTAQEVRLVSAIAAADATRAQLQTAHAALDTSGCQIKGLKADLQVRQG